MLGSLASALAEPTGSEVDVLVVLDGSTDGSDVLVDEMVAGFPVPLRHVWQPNRGLAAARNVGIAAATGDLVWLLDDDMVVERSAVVRHSATPRCSPHPDGAVRRALRQPRHHPRVLVVRRTASPAGGRQHRARPARRGVREHLGAHHLVARASVRRTLPRLRPGGLRTGGAPARSG
ncbi:MAG: glycosyltransferase family 2 protein [Acidimicrobiaceae bacterium]|nr:glycosyltransferase family 2 protein [Acidimicrobiaceae bacterium]